MRIEWRPAVSAVLLAALTLTVKAAAQVPSLPVLQNAFGSPGLAFAADVGGGSGHAFYGAAGAWGLGSNGRFTVSAAAGAENANGSTRGAYGGRLAAQLWTNRTGALGVGAFAGFGGAPRTRSDSIVTNPAVAIVPAGATVGYRREIGTSGRGISIYVSPFYRWVRIDSGDVVSSSAFRVSAGLDFSFTPSFGVTLGGEFGGSHDGNGDNALIGGAVSFVPGRRR